MCCNFELLTSFILQSLNYELTAGYLNLVVNLICLMILLSRVDDRKVVLGIFHMRSKRFHLYFNNRRV